MFFIWYKQGDLNPPTSYFAFGGMYGYRDSGIYVNPITGGQSCPALYKFTGKVFGTTNVDHDISICWNEVDSPPGPLDQAILFGGMYGYGTTTTYINPLTAAATCPDTYHPAQMLGTDKRDLPLWLCYKLQTDFIIK